MRGANKVLSSCRCQPVLLSGVPLRGKQTTRPYYVYYILCTISTITELMFCASLKVVTLFFSPNSPLFVCVCLSGVDSSAAGSGGQSPRVQDQR